MQTIFLYITYIYVYIYYRLACEAIFKEKVPPTHRFTELVKKKIYTQNKYVWV